MASKKSGLFKNLSLGQKIGLLALAVLLLSFPFFLKITQEGIKLTLPWAGGRYESEIFKNINEYRDVVFAEVVAESGQKVKLKLDLFEPKGDTLEKRPAVIMLPGGSFQSAPRSWVIEDAKSLARMGYVAVAAEYRVRPDEVVSYAAPEKALPVILDAQHDVQAAVRFLRLNSQKYKIDQEKIGIVGISSGAITGLYVAYNWEDPGTSGNPGYSSKVQTVVSIAGAMYQAQNYIRAGDPPLLMFHGTADGAVPYAMAVETKEAAEAVGVPVKFVAFPGQKHVIWNNKEIKPGTNNFLFQYLVGESPPTNPPTTPTPPPTPVASSGTNPPEATPSPSIEPGSGRQTARTKLICSLANQYFAIRGYPEKEEDRKDLERLIKNWGRIIGLDKLGIYSVDQFLAFYNTVCIRTN